KGFVFIRTGPTGEATVTASPYFASLPTESLPATGYNLVAVRLEVAQEVLGMVTTLGSAAS
ncbi:MAG: hypothetical protein DRH23_15240, partial [Deltaproteobacteria bacterium]